MSATVWDQEFFRRRAAGEQAAGGPEPAAVTPLAPGHVTIAGLLLARTDDDNTALLFEDQRWSWRELVQEALARRLTGDIRLSGIFAMTTRTGEGSAAAANPAR